MHITFQIVDNFKVTQKHAKFCFGVPFSLNWKKNCLSFPNKGAHHLISDGGIEVFDIQLGHGTLKKKKRNSLTVLLPACEIVRSLGTCLVATHELLHLHQDQSSHGEHLVDSIEGTL